MHKLDLRANHSRPKLINTLFELMVEGWLGI